MFSSCWEDFFTKGQIARMSHCGTREKPDTIGLHRINGETKVVTFGVGKSIFQLEIAESLDKFVLSQRSNNWEDKLEIPG